MLLLVAAVKAARTHNRRRVTGSSGRRREGRESERQRPNMSQHLLYSAVLLLVVMMCCNTGGAAQAAVEEVQPSQTKFEWKGITEGGETVESLGVPGLLKVGSDVFAVAEAQCKQGQDSFTGIASQLLTMETGNKPEEIMDDARKDTQFLEEGSTANNKKVDVSRPTTVVEGSDIYMLVGKHSHENPAKCKAKSEKIKSGMLLVKGEVGKTDKKIHWNETGGLPCTLGEEHESLSQLIFGGGSGVKLRDATFLFPVEATKKKEDKKDVKTASLIIHNSADTLSWRLSKGMSEGGCSDPSVVEWEKDKLMMMTACDDGRRRVYEIGDKGDSWTEALGTLSRVWGNKKGNVGSEKGVRSGFITAKIDNRNVMLVTLPAYARKDNKDNGNGVLHLWLTDNTHIVDIGPVSEKEDDVTASSLLYKSGNDNNEKLIALYEKKKGVNKEISQGMVSVHLTEQLEKVKEVLKKWKEVDERVSKLCTTLLAQKVTSTDSACTTDVKITDGLVGFLSGNFSGNTWRDEYLGVNATVNKNDDRATEAFVAGGVTFRGAWAEWSVGKQGENQLYHFANYNFTLVATVSIDGEPTEGNIPLMGVKMMKGDSENTVLLGLSYNKEKKWILLCGDGKTKELKSTWEPGKKHQLAIVLQNGSQISAYVDDQPVGGDEQCALETTDSKEISHFYIGGDGGNTDNTRSREGVSVTVSNVLLYNRPLDEVEVGALNPNKAPISPQVPENAQGSLSQSSPDGQPPSDLKLLDGNEGVGGGSMSTTVVSTVTTSLGKEQSKIQLSSETSPDGKKNVDGGSSSNDDQTVEAEAGDTVPGDGLPQAPAGTPATADANTPTATGKRKVDPAVTTGVSASSGGNEETAGGGYAQKEAVQSQDGEVNGTALSSSLGNVSQGNNTDSGTVSESRVLPSLLLLLLGLWGFAAL
ncbi:putative trans-sialidase, Group V [Trypanosoma cruzi]|nr:putative trans-sialidase, Group V [Trypanosoma cruzi]